MRTASLKAVLALSLLAAGMLELGQGAYIHAKAVLAQVLLERAWDRTLDGDVDARPWAWADTWPVARLKVAALGIDQIVLEGESGNVLAFAPGRLHGSAASGVPGRMVISGHRDTHFHFLKDIAAGEVLKLQFAGGGERDYRVVAARVADTRQEDGDLLYPQSDGLTLITCYPFDALSPGGPLRYLVHADPV